MVDPTKQLGNVPGIVCEVELGGRIPFGNIARDLAEVKVTPYSSLRNSVTRFQAP